MQLNFNPQTVEPQKAFENMPVGWYLCTITKEETKPNSKQTGHYSELELTVQGGQYDGRKVWDRLNLENPSETAVKIAQETLSAICHAINWFDLQDTSQLVGATLEVKIGLSKTSEQYPDPINEPKGYRAPQQQGAQQPVQQQPQQQQMAQQFQQPAQQQAPQQQQQPQQPQFQQQQQPAQQQQAPQQQQGDWQNQQMNTSQPQQGAQQQQQAPQEDPQANDPNVQQAQTTTPPWQK